MPIAFACPHCACPLEISDALAGHTAQCSGCRGLVVVPGPEGLKPGRPAAAVAGSPRFHCPFCGSSSPPNVRKKVSTAGWAVFIALLFACFLFAPLAMLIRDERRYCRDCGLGLD